MSGPLEAGLAQHLEGQRIDHLGRLRTRALRFEASLPPPIEYRLSDLAPRRVAGAEKQHAKRTVGGDVFSHECGRRWAEVGEFRRVAYRRRCRASIVTRIPPLAEEGFRCRGKEKQLHDAVLRRQFLGGAHQRSSQSSATDIWPNGERPEQAYLPEQLQPDHGRKTVVVTTTQEADGALFNVSGWESACLEQVPNGRRVLSPQSPDDHAWPPQHSLPQQAVSTATGLVARMNAPMNRPSICGAISSASRPDPARKARASSAL